MTYPTWKFPAPYQPLTASGSVSNTAGGAVVATLNANRSGIWSVKFRGTIHQGGSAPPGSLALYVGGVNADGGSFDAGGPDVLDVTVIGLFWESFAANGTQFQVQATSDQSTVTGTLTATFIPTPANPQ